MMMMKNLVGSWFRSAGYFTEGSKLSPDGLLSQYNKSKTFSFNKNLHSICVCLNASLRVWGRVQNEQVCRIEHKGKYLCLYKHIVIANTHGLRYSLCIQRRSLFWIMLKVHTQESIVRPRRNKRSLTRLLCLLSCIFEFVSHHLQQRVNFHIICLDDHVKFYSTIELDDSWKRLFVVAWFVVTLLAHESWQM